MNFLKNLFSKKDEKTIHSYTDFWKWFEVNEQKFYTVLKSRTNPERDFFDKLMPQLEKIKEGFYFLAGMLDDETAELVFTPDGRITNIVFVEELVKSAPTLPKWKFTALKPAMDSEKIRIEMAGYKFDSETISFYPVDHKDFPDKIDIAIAYKDYQEENKSLITNGVYIYLDNYLGELNFVSAIDNITVVSNSNAEKELIPISKLKDYLTWRVKEFSEKYNGLRYDTENDSHFLLEGSAPNGNPVIMVINTVLLDWDSKASHPWILKIESNYRGEANNGMPTKDIYELLNTLEEEIGVELKDFDGYLNVGRRTGDNCKTIYIACREYRKPSKVLFELSKKYSGRLELSYDIYKDKYWQSLETFRPHQDS